MVTIPWSRREGEAGEIASVEGRTVTAEAGDGAPAAAGEVGAGGEVAGLNGNDAVGLDEIAGAGVGGG